MSDAPPPAAPPESPAEREERAAVRRRWVNLGELLAVVAVLISALTLWNSWRERTAAEEKDVRAEAKAKVAAAAITLGAAADKDGRRLSLTSLRDDQTIQGQTILFPSALKVAAVETTGDPRIEAGWFEDALRKLEKDRGGTDRHGDARLPVLVVTRFLADGEAHTARAYYDVGYALEEGGLFGGRRVRLKGLSLIGAAPANPAPERLDRLWAARR